jgi:hypothetical protein
MAFTRGENIVELVSKDPTANGVLRFFLVRFTPACESLIGGCTYADMLTPTVESNWTEYTVYDDETIKNTILDCLQCHQPKGPATPKILRMQELRSDWNHWFYPSGFQSGGRKTRAGQFVNEFRTTHGTLEDYGAIPANRLFVSSDANSASKSRPAFLEGLVEHNGFQAQPNEYISITILQELQEMGTSPTWDGLYANSVAGVQIAVPFAGNPFDPAKITTMSTAYGDTMNGTLPRDQMPDIRDVFLDSALADLSFRPKAGLNGRGIMTHMCQHCHNSNLDQTLSRARFNIQRLDLLSRIVKDEAIRRLQLPVESAEKMPPARFHTLSNRERDLVIQELMN